MSNKHPNIATSSPERDWELNPRFSETGSQLSEAYKEGLTHRVAMVAILNQKGQVLLQRRGPNVLWPDVWDISAAGHVDAGHTYMQSAIREASEEVGIDVTATTDTNPMVQIAHYHDVEKLDPGHDQRFPDTESVSRWNTLFGYVVPYGIEYSLDDDDEVKDAMWADLDELRQMLTRTPDEFRPGAALALAHLITAIDDGKFKVPGQD